VNDHGNFSGLTKDAIQNIIKAQAEVTKTLTQAQIVPECAFRI